MSTIAEIKSAIERLSLEERAELVADLCGWADDDWDKQMKADAKAGKFAALNEDAAHAIQAGAAVLTLDSDFRRISGQTVLDSLD